MPAPQIGHKMLCTTNRQVACSSRNIARKPCGGQSGAQIDIEARRQRSCCCHFRCCCELSSYCQNPRNTFHVKNAIFTKWHHQIFTNAEQRSRCYADDFVPEPSCCSLYVGGVAVAGAVVSPAGGPSLVTGASVFRFGCGGRAGGLGYSLFLV